MSFVMVKSWTLSNEITLTKIIGRCYHKYIDQLIIIKFTSQQNIAYFCIFSFLWAIPNCFVFLFRQIKHMLQLPRQQLDIFQRDATVKILCINLPIPISTRESQVLGYWWEWFGHNWNFDWEGLGKLASSFASYNWQTLFSSPQLIDSLAHWWSSGSTNFFKDLFVQHRK